MPETVDVRTSLGKGRGGVVTAELGELVAEGGVPLPLEKGDQQALVVMPTPCCSHTACNAVSAARPADGDGEPGFHALFDTAEHAIIVAGLKLKTEALPLDAARAALPLALGQSYSLTYGQLIALGGDFYGDPDHPVCKAGNLQAQVAQFSANFKSMAAAKAEVQNILAVADHYEFGPIAQAVRTGRQPSSVYAALPTSPGHIVPGDEDRAFDAATNGRYLNLAKTNFDHFGVDAIACYTAGHWLAQDTAAKAKGISDNKARAQALLLAYAMNAFADHFLTDLFAAGHMRTPRRSLYDSADNDITRMGAGVCAKQMHDEDNKFGLWVTNSVGDTWVAYGDARYRDKWNAAGRVIVKAAVQQSMDDVWASFAAGNAADADASGVLRYIPKVIREIRQPATAPKHRDDSRNWAPLFWWNPGDGNVWRRNKLFDPSDRSYCEQGEWYDPTTWGISSTVLQLGQHPPVFMPPSSYYRFPPDETGMTGEYGWPPQPGSMTGPQGATGPTLAAATGWSWTVDGAPGPSQVPATV